MPATRQTGLIEAFDLPDDLGVAPLGAFTARGQVGGTISAASGAFTVHNSGAAILSWTVQKSQLWFTQSATPGTLAPGASATVTASFNSGQPAALRSLLRPPDFHQHHPRFHLTRTVSLMVDSHYNPLFSETFESGGLGSAWAVTGTASHRTRVTTENEPHAGTRHLAMDSGVDDTHSRNEATLTLDLAGRTHLALSFWVKMFNDEADPPVASPFTTGADFDGVAVTDDVGTVWHEIRDLRSPAERMGRRRRHH